MPEDTAEEPEEAIPVLPADEGRIGKLRASSGG